MQITHEQARKWAQLNVDETLGSQEKAILAAHLAACSECQTYARDLRQVEDLLRPVMERHWNRQPVPLSAHALIARRDLKTQANAILTMRTAVVTLVLMAFMFGTWQFLASGAQTADQMPVEVLPVPTPSAHSTSTRIMFQNCQERLYHVQANDTLDSIAAQFSISKEQIMAINNMTSEELHAAMELRVPSCNFTPTGTISPTKHRTTYTPLKSYTTSTPDG